MEKKSDVSLCIGYAWRVDNGWKYVWHDELYDKEMLSPLPFVDKIREYDAALYSQLIFFVGTWRNDFLMMSLDLVQTFLIDFVWRRFQSNKNVIPWKYHYCFCIHSSKRFDYVDIHSRSFISTEKTIRCVDETISLFLSFEKIRKEITRLHQWCIEKLFNCLHSLPMHRLLQLIDNIY